MIVADRLSGAQIPQHVPAVGGQAHHLFLVGGVARGRAITQHRETPGHHGRAEPVILDDERGVFHEQPFEGLLRHIRRGPGRGIARRNFARIGKARLKRRAAHPVHHGHVMAIKRSIIGGCDAHHACAQNDNFHDFISSPPLGGLLA